MSDLNHLFLQGRLTKDASFREVQTARGQARVADLSLAVNRPKKAADGYENAASFFNVSAFTNGGKTENYLKKGQQIIIEGYLRQDRWEKDGKKRGAISIGVTNLNLIFPQKAKPSDVPDEAADGAESIVIEGFDEEKDVFIEDLGDENFE